MNEDIEFLYNFILYDREHLEELYVPLHSVLQEVGNRLRRRFPHLTFVYNSEDSPMYELIELLDGNNFEIKYGKTVLGHAAVEAIPLYPEETITVTVEIETEATENIPKIRNPSRKGLRAKILLIDDIAFDEKLFNDSIKPP